MHTGELLRNWIGSNLALIAFLCAYFLTAVLGNLLYPFAVGTRIAGFTLNGFNLSKFSSASTVGYWLLLLLPFVFTPCIAGLTRVFLRRKGAQFSRGMKDFHPAHYAAISCICYAYVIIAFWSSGGFDLSFQGVTPDESVASRFRILEGLGYWPQMVLKSILMFLSTYSFVMALRKPSAFWSIFAVLNICIMSFLLLSLNMKWPILLLYVSAAICIFLYSRRFPYVIASICILGIVIVYLLVGLVVTRWLPGSDTPPRHAMPVLLIGAINRMAISYPFYYETFSNEGQVCGTIIDRMLRKKNPCHPSNLIFDRMTRGGGFGGKGTEPAAVHISGYALDGWSGALLELGIASAVIGAFITLSFSLATGAMTQTILVMGALTGYYFSQLPLEAAFIYDHGLVWWLTLAAVYSGLRCYVAPSDLVR